MNDVYSLSYHATLMSKDVPVGDIHGRTVTPLREELLPIYFQRGGDFAQWLSMRDADEFPPAEESPSPSGKG